MCDIEGSSSMTSKRLKLDGLSKLSCVVCANHGKEFEATDQAGLLQHLKQFHRARVLVASKYKPGLKKVNTSDDFGVTMSGLDSQNVSENTESEQLGVIEEIIEASGSTGGMQATRSGQQSELEHNPLGVNFNTDPEQQEISHETLVGGQLRHKKSTNQTNAAYERSILMRGGKDLQALFEKSIVAISCIRCNKTYSMVEHNENRVGTLQCGLCRWSFQSPVHLRCHMDHFHHDEHKCPLCPFSVKKGGVTVMDRHYGSKHASEKIFHCYLCEQEFTRKGCFYTHVARHFKSSGEFECPHCHMRFQHSQRVNIHVVQSHSMLLGVPKQGAVVPSKEKTSYMCGVCGKRYSYAGTLQMHLKKHQEENSLDFQDGGVDLNDPAIQWTGTLLADDDRDIGDVLEKNFHGRISEAHLTSNAWQSVVRGDSNPIPAAASQVEEEEEEEEPARLNATDNSAKKSQDMERADKDEFINSNQLINTDNTQNDTVDISQLKTDMVLGSVRLVNLASNSANQVGD